MGKFYIYTQILQGNVLFSGKIYTVVNIFTRLLVVTAATNFKSVLGNHQYLWIIKVHIVIRNNFVTAVYLVHQRPHFLLKILLDHRRRGDLQNPYIHLKSPVADIKRGSWLSCCSPFGYSMSIRVQFDNSTAPL